MDDVIAVVPDLFFQSRISAAARHLGRTVRYAAAEQLDSVDGFRLALVDLDSDPDISGTISRLRSVGAGPLIAFGPHVDTQRRKLARMAGADRVLAKSKFVVDLPTILTSTREEA